MAGCTPSKAKRLALTSAPDQAFGLIPAGDGGGGVAIHADVLEDGVLLPPIQVIRIRNAQPVKPMSLVILVEEHQPGGVFERERPQHHRIDRLKIVVLTPMPSASVSTATAVKPGFFTSIRKAKRRSFMAMPESGAAILSGRSLTPCATTAASEDVCARSAPVSSSTMRPSNRCTVRSACRAKRWSCVTMQIVAPSRCRSRSNSITASPFLESRLPVGSSASRIEGLPAEGARHRHALLLAARELRRVMLHAMRHADLFERLLARAVCARRRSGRDRSAATPRSRTRSGRR